MSDFPSVNLKSDFLLSALKKLLEELDKSGEELENKKINKNYGSTAESQPRTFIYASNAAPAKRIFVEK